MTSGKKLRAREKETDDERGMGVLRGGVRGGKGRGRPQEAGIVR